MGDARCFVAVVQPTPTQVELRQLAASDTCGESLGCGAVGAEAIVSPAVQQGVAQVELQQSA
jgi:hypothetical protein